MADTQHDSTSYPTNKIILAGLGIALGAIALFAGLWFGLRALGVSQLASLIVAVCAPPAIMTVIVLYVYFTRSVDP